MSYGYQQYGGNPYEQETPGSEHSQQPAPYDQQGNPYGTSSAPQQAHPVATQDNSYSAEYNAGGASTTQNTGGYGGLNGEPGIVRVPAPPRISTNQEFLARVEAVRSQIRELTTSIGEIGSVHQRLISSPDANHAQLDNLVTNTQILNTKIQSQIRELEADAKKSGDNTTKNSQIRTLKGQFRSQLEDYQKEESAYKRRYQEQIAREYKIVNPEATDTEVREAAEADWGNEGVFQTAVSDALHRRSQPYVLTCLTSSNPTAPAPPPASWATSARATTTSSASNRRSSTSTKCS